MSTGLTRPGLAHSAHRGRIKFLRGYVFKSSTALNQLSLALSGSLGFILGHLIEKFDEEAQRGKEMKKEMKKLSIEKQLKE